MKTITFGIMGAGKIARKFCNAITDVPGTRVVAVSSKSLERATEFTTNNGVPQAYGSYEAMLEECELDAVYVATTTNFHYENVKMALEAGKHVICEKSMVTSLSEAEELFSLAREKGVLLMEGMWSRFLPNIQKAKEWLDAGRIGTPYTAHCEIGFTPPRAVDNRYFAKELGGGSLYDIGVYAFEIMTYLLGQEPLEVKTLGYLTEETGVDCSAVIAMRFERCVASILSTFMAKSDSRMIISGEKGRIEIPKPHNGNRAYLHTADGTEEFENPARNGFCYEIEEFAACIRAGKPESAVVPHKDTLLCQRIFDQCYTENNQTRLRLLDSRSNYNNVIKMLGGHLHETQFSTQSRGQSESRR